MVKPEIRAADDLLHGAKKRMARVLQELWASEITSPPFSRQKELVSV